jgi:hypothetical protein
VGCLSSEDGCYFQPEVHQSCVSCPPFPDAYFLSWEGVVHQLVMEGINQSSQEAVLPLGIHVDILWGITRQLQELVPVLADGQGTLF